MAIAAVLVLMLGACAAWARTLDDQERASLAAAVKDLVAAMHDGDYARVVQTVPPKMIGAFARRAGATPDQIVVLMANVMEKAFQGDDIKFGSFSMDLGSADHKELPSGVPYLFIPSQTVVSVGGQSIREKSHMLALLDEGNWYFLRIKDAPHLKFLLDAYPEFTSVEFPSGSIEALHQ